MKNLTIRLRIVASFAVVLALMVVTAGVAYTRLLNIEGQATVIATEAVPGLTYTNQIVLQRRANYSLTEDFLRQTDPAARKQLHAAILASREELDALYTKYSATITLASEQDLSDAYDSAVGLYRATQDGVLRAGLNPPPSPATRAELYSRFDASQSAAGALLAYNTAGVVNSTNRIVTSVNSARLGLLVTVGLALAVAAICGYFLLRAITRPLRGLVDAVDAMRTGDLSGRVAGIRDDEFGTLAAGFNRMTEELAGLVCQVQASGLQVDASVTDIAAAAQGQQAAASQIATSMTEIGATSRGITAMARTLVGTMHDVAALAQQSAGLAERGQHDLTYMRETMTRVTAASRSVTAALADLSRKAGSITEVITTIITVADRTNLLSLNAAIEAEKAGEYGRGFAVVATEIRRLADETAVASNDIGQIVMQIRSAVAASVAGMDMFAQEVGRGTEAVQQVGVQLSQIIQHVQALAPRVETVNNGMQAQASGAEQITESLSQVTRAARYTVDSLRESGHAIDELTRVATVLRGGVSRFTVQGPDGGSTVGPGALSLSSETP
jgi:methyl-accepting chemotaxis protein WspA